MLYEDYESVYNDTKRGKHFLCGRFLMMNETPKQKEHVFDKRASEFIHFVDAVVLYLTDLAMGQ